VRQSDCEELAELRSAYVDGALGDADRELVLNHLARCPECRAEVADLRGVSRLLGQVGQRPPGPPETADLSSKLVSIAGEAAHEPVWCRPFRRSRAGSLPSVRRIVRVRATAAGLAFGGLLSTLGLVGYLAAPPVQATQVSDPSGRVRSEFAATLNQFPLASRSISALMVSPAAALRSRPGRLPATVDPAAAQLPVTNEMALSVLDRAASESDDVSYFGTQEVAAATADHVVSATARISYEAGQGTSVTVQDQAGRPALNGFVPMSTSTRINDEQLLGLLERNYAITGWSGSTVLGRAVTVVEATRDAVGPAVAARWWIDNATGLLLRQEAYDESGAVALTSGFTSLTITGGPVYLDHLAPRLATSTTTASLTLSNAAQLSSLGWFCHQDLSGLSLVRLRSDAAANPGTLHMVYSDGLSSLSVFEQRGALTGAPAGSRWDEPLGAYVTAGTPSLATWQSGDRVFTVVSDGAPRLVAEAVRTLPHATPLTRTTMDRVHAGWVRILQRVVR
jgi:hypothetical protein